MTDRQIIERLLKCDESALKELSEKYDNYCYTVAYRILRCDSDTEECINDVWLAVWGSVPPEHPDDLKAFLSKVTRNIATARYWPNGLRDIRFFKPREKRGCLKTSPILQAIKQPLFVFYN